MITRQCALFFISFRRYPRRAQRHTRRLLMAALYLLRSRLSTHFPFQIRNQTFQHEKTAPEGAVFLFIPVRRGSRTRR